MSRLPWLLLALVLTAAAHAQSFDLSSTLEAPAEVRPGQAFTLRGTVTNLGPGPASGVMVYLGAYDYTPPCVEALDFELAAGQTRAFECTITARPRPYFIRAYLNAVSPHNERDHANNSAQREIRLITPPDLAISPISGVVVIPGLPFTQGLSYANQAATAATGVTLTIDTEAEILRAPENCTVDGPRAICNIGTLGPAGFGHLVFQFRAPDISAHRFRFTARIAGNEEDAGPLDDERIGEGITHRTFFVTDTGGSLRAAFEGANASCDGSYPCLIAFRIPPGPQRWHTISVDAPLPRLTAKWLLIDGTTQRAYFSDSNPDGPEIEITGSEAAGNGIELESSNNTIVKGLTINGFPGAGVRLLGKPSGTLIVSDNYIGTDPAGARAVPNERGIVVEVDEHSATWRIFDNVISGNRRSGIFVQSGPATKISRNKIGLDARVTAPLGNGASGVYIAPPGRGTDLTDNHIGFNAHFGVAIARGTADVALYGNSFQGNGQLAIDYDLDGVATAEPIMLPEITSVRFENDRTIVEGLARASGTFAPRVQVYANDAPDPSGYGEGQYFLGYTHTDNNTGRFTFTHNGDLRGKWIAVTQTRMFYYGFLRTQGNESLIFTTTSEFSRAVEVE